MTILTLTVLLLPLVPALESNVPSKHFWREYSIKSARFQMIRFARTNIRLLTFSLLIIYSQSILVMQARQGRILVLSRGGYFQTVFLLAYLGN